MSRLTDEINQIYDLEKIRVEAANKLSAKEWSDFLKLRDRYEGKRRFAGRAYQLEREERVAMARLRLIDKAGQKDRGFKPPWATDDRFDKEAIDRQARKLVRQAYLNELVRLDREEVADIREMISASEYQRLEREKPQRDFARASDRRSGLERRTRSRD